MHNKFPELKPVYFLLIASAAPSIEARLYTANPQTFSSFSKSSLTTHLSRSGLFCLASPPGPRGLLSGSRIPAAPQTPKTITWISTPIQIRMKTTSSLKTSWPRSILSATVAVLATLLLQEGFAAAATIRYGDYLSTELSYCHAGPKTREKHYHNHFQGFEPFMMLAVSANSLLLSSHSLRSKSPTISVSSIYLINRSQT